jgi:signal transduction histidine kinase/integral membrane sensor domain MASE1
MIKTASATVATANDGPSVSLQPLPRWLLIPWFAMYIATGYGITYFQPEVGPFVWYPPISLAIVAVIIWGPWVAIPILFCDFSISMRQFGGDVSSAATVSVMTAAEALLAGWIYKRLMGDKPLFTIGDLCKVAFVACLVPTIAGPMVGSLLLSGLPTNVLNPTQMWISWTIGDVASSLIMVPPMLVLWQRYSLKASLGDLPSQVRDILLAILISVVALVARFLLTRETAHPVAYSLYFAPILLAAVRLTIAQACVLILSISGVSAIGDMLLEHFVWQKGSSWDLVNTQVSLIAITLCGLALALSIDLERSARATGARLNLELERTELIVNRLSSAIPNLLVGVDSQGMIRWVRGESSFLADGAASNQIGKPLSKWAHPVFEGAVNRTFADASNNATAVVRANPDQIRSSWLEVSLVSLPDDASKDTVLLIRDVSDRESSREKIEHLAIELEQKVMDRTQELRRSNRETEAFTYAVSHDLRGPIRAVGAYAQMLSEDYEGVLDDTAKSYIDRIQHAQKQMASITEGLLRLSRLSRAELVLSKVDLSSLASQIAHDAMDRYPGFTWKAQPDLYVEGDKEMLHVLLANLIENAFKFSSQSDLKVIEFGHDERSYFVRDSGPGFPMADAEVIFEPFRQVTPDRRSQGLGIGLATCKRIVERHGGKIWAESDPGQGATFRFTLNGL